MRAYRSFTNRATPTVPVETTSWTDGFTRRCRIKFIERAYLDYPYDWEKVTEEYVRERLDGQYRDVDMAMVFLHEAGTIRTPFAMYRVVPESVKDIRWIGAGGDETGRAAGRESNGE